MSEKLQRRREDETRIDKGVYYGECIRRHPQLCQDVLAFHEQFPPLFKRTHQRGRARADTEFSAKETRSWVRTHQRSQGTDCVIIVPKTIADIALLYSPFTVLELRAAGYGLPLLPEYGQYYFDLMQISPVHWKQAWETLQRAWPKVPEAFLRYGTLSEAWRPSLLVPNEPFTLQEWSEQLTRAAADSKLMIPVYPDTTQDDIERLCVLVQRLKEWVYRPSSEDQPHPSS
jgi:hypothetical protein